MRKKKSKFDVRRRCGVACFGNNFGYKLRPRRPKLAIKEAIMKAARGRYSLEKKLILKA